MRRFLAFLACLAAGASLAQTYPARPVRIMVGASPGGGTDIIARMLADKFAASMKQPFIVENRPGASNTIAADVTAKPRTPGKRSLRISSSSVSIR